MSSVESLGPQLAARRRAAASPINLRRTSQLGARADRTAAPPTRSSCTPLPQPRLALSALVVVLLPVLQLLARVLAEPASAHPASASVRPLTWPQPCSTVRARSQKWSNRALPRFTPPHHRATTTAVPRAWSRFSAARRRPPCRDVTQDRDTGTPGDHGNCQRHAPSNSPASSGHSTDVPPRCCTAHTAHTAHTADHVTRQTRRAQHT
jgi:hypothetical protein